MTRPLLLFVLIAVQSGCVGDESESASSEPPPPAPTCAEHELALPDGSCIRPGVPLDGCADGFEHDGEYGCEPILPLEPCPLGQMAVPGDSACRPVMGCGSGPWGELPVDGATVYVDGSYAGGDGDGSATKPWPTISEALLAAAPGALVAVAAGSYGEDLLIRNKPVRLWGVCPEQVEVVATGQFAGPCPPAALCIIGSADGTEVGGLALRGASTGIVLSGSVGVVVDRVHIHDNAVRGLNIQGTLGQTSIELRGSLVEQNRGIGMFVAGSDAIVDTSTVRTTLPRVSDQLSGSGISVTGNCVETATGASCSPSGRASLSVRGSLIEQNLETGVLVLGSDAVVEASVVRTTSPTAANQLHGIGLSVQIGCVETSMGLRCDSSARSKLDLRSSIIEQNHELGLFVSGSDAVVEATVVRATLPRGLDQGFGRGIMIQLSCMDTSLGSRCDEGARANASVRGSLIDQNHDTGVLVNDSDASVELSVVRGTQARVSDSLFGDGVAVVSHETPASLVVAGVLIKESARAGLGNYGAFVGLSNSQINCAALPLIGEVNTGTDPEFTDGGGNLCGCPVADGECKVVSSDLAPPGTRE